MATAPLSSPRPRLRSLPCARPLIPRRGSLLLAAHAYRRPPTGARRTRAPLTPGRARVRSLLATPASSLPHLPGRAPLSCETFRREPATRQFVWSFAPTPTSRQRVEHQYGSGPPPAFPPASASAGVVHCLSGPTAATPGSPPASALARPPRRGGGLLGPCFNTGPSPRRPCTFAFHRPQASFHISLALLLRYRPRSVFSLRCLYHRFALRYQAALLVPRTRPGLSPASAPLSSGFGAPSRNASRPTTGAAPCSLAATTGIHVCFFSWP